MAQSFLQRVRSAISISIGDERKFEDKFNVINPESLKKIREVSLSNASQSIPARQETIEFDEVKIESQISNVGADADKDINPFNIGNIQERYVAELRVAASCFVSEHAGHYEKEFAKEQLASRLMGILYGQLYDELVGIAHDNVRLAHYARGYDNTSASDELIKNTKKILELIQQMDPGKVNENRN